MTPLHYACQSDSFEIFNFLREQNVNINQRDNKGRTPLNIACEYNSFKIFKILIEKEVDIN